MNIIAGAQEKYSATANLPENPTLTADREAEATAAGVSSREYVDYAAKLAIYEARSDTEFLADRRARESGETFADGNFARAVAYDGTSEAKETSRT